MIAVVEPFECTTSRCAGKTWTVLGAVYDTRQVGHGGQAVLAFDAYTSLVIWWRCMDCYQVTLTGGLV